MYFHRWHAMIIEWLRHLLNVVEKERSDSAYAIVELQLASTRMDEQCTEQLMHLRDENASLCDCELELESERSDLEKQLADYEATIAADAFRIDVLLAYVDGDLAESVLSAQFAGLSPASVELTRENRQLGDLVADSRRAQEGTEERNRALEGKCAELGEEVQAADAETNAITIQRHHLTERCAQLEVELEAHSSETTALKSEKIRLDEKCLEIETRMEALASESAAKRSEINDLQEKYSQIVIEMESACSKDAELKSQKSCLEKKCMTLVKEITAFTAVAKHRNAALIIRNAGLQEGIADCTSKSWEREKLLRCQAVAKQEAFQKLEPILSLQKVLDEKIALLRTKFDTVLARVVLVSGDENAENLLTEMENLLTAAEEVRGNVTVDVVRFVDAHLRSSDVDFDDNVGFVEEGVQAIRSQLTALEVQLEDISTKFPELAPGCSADATFLDDSLECRPSARTEPSKGDEVGVVPLRLVLEGVEVRRLRRRATAHLEATVTEQFRPTTYLSETFKWMSRECTEARAVPDALRAGEREWKNEMEKLMEDLCTKNLPFNTVNSKELPAHKVETAQMFRVGVEDVKSKSNNDKRGDQILKEQLQIGAVAHEAKLAEFLARLK